MKKSCIFISILSLFSTVAPATAAAFATGLDRLAAYAGTWMTEVGHFETPFSKAGKNSATIKNDCWLSDNYYVCNHYINGNSKTLLVYTYDPKDDTYTVYPIIAGENEVRPGKLIIHGNVWTFPWDKKEKGKTIYFRVTNVFTAVDTIEYREEYSMDSMHWYPMAQGYEKKLH
jgi:hypothetical protein